MSVARIMDANANRAREALRVLEDAARFQLDDARLCGEAKRLRHDLRAALDLLPPGWLEVNRDTPGDVGTRISAGAEGERAGLPGVAAAAGKRAGEALRVLEEVGKTVAPEMALRIEAIRYRLYDVESALHRRLGSGRARQWRVCLLLTESACARPWRDVLRAAVSSGADCVQVREKTMDGAALRRRAAEVIEVARPAGAAVVVNDRLDVAQAAGADGVHLGPTDLAVADARRLAGRALLIGASTRGPEDADAAVEAGADYCGVGTMFRSPTRPGGEPRGPGALRDFARRHPRTPHLAIGGITPDNVGRLVEAGARGVAVCAAVCGADDPGAVVGALREALAGTPARPAADRRQ